MGEYCQTQEEEILPILLQPFQKINMKVLNFQINFQSS